MNNKIYVFKSIFKLIKIFLCLIFKIIKITTTIIKTTIDFLSEVLSKIVNSIINKLRFSITFKITVAYVFIFMLISSFMSIVILTTFNYFLRNSLSIDYIFILAVLLGVCNLIGIILILTIGSKTSKKLLYPIKTMTDTVNEISINALHKRLDVRGSKDELKDLAKTFNDMLDRIEKSVELQNQFVSDASHELRTPISVIQGYINLLNRWGKDDKAVLEESILAIKSESENMKDLIEKLLFLARGDKNTQKVEKQKFNLNELIDEVLKETRLIDNTHHILCSQNEQFVINADKKLLKESLRIFIDNSLKYTPENGTIQLNSFIKNNTAIIAIEDNGVGISENDIPYIFNRFYRSDKSRTKQSGGTGLGLSIAKWIIDNHSGTIHVSSKINFGTNITITLPIF